MHKEIEHYLSVHTFDTRTQWGMVNEGKNLSKALEENGNDESKFLRNIDIYSIRASNGHVSINKQETRTFLNVGKFSFYYHGNCYESTIFDNNGKPSGGSYWIVEESLNKPKVNFYSGKASGTLFIYSDCCEDGKKRILERVEREVLLECREKFGRW